MEKTNFMKVKNLFDTLGEHASYFSGTSENGFMVDLESESAKSIYGDDEVVTVRTNTNRMNSTKAMKVTVMEYDTFKNIHVEVDYTGLGMILADYGEDIASDKWNKFITGTTQMSVRDASGFNVQYTENEDGTKVEVSKPIYSLENR